MHFPSKLKQYPTPSGRALMALCLRQEAASGVKLTRIHEGELTVNQNALEQATEGAPLKLTQSTITRLLEGKRATSTKTFRALAKFFGVSVAVVMGEEELPPASPPTDPIGARLWGLWGQVPLGARLECLEVAIRATPDGLLSLDSRKKSED